MKLFYLFLIFLSPFIVMISVNENSRNHQLELPPSEESLKLNSSIANPNICTWACHNYTTYCKDNHTKLLYPYFQFTDPIYFGVINALQSTGSYSISNLILFLIIGPLVLFIMLLRVVRNWSIIHQHKKATKWLMWPHFYIITVQISLLILPILRAHRIT